MILGLLLAGGDSIRMGQEKARLLIGGEEAWLHLARKMLDAGCSSVFMGIPARLLDPLTPLIPQGFDIRLEVVPESHRQRGAIGSLAHLLSQVEGSIDICLVAPVDHPYIMVETLHKLLGGKGAIRIPTHGGRRGHPIVLEADVAHRVPSLKGTLKTLTRDPAIHVVEIPVQDEAVHWNLDRPEDYGRFGNGS